MSDRRVEIGISDKDREVVSRALSAVLADTYTLYLKTHGYHWNVMGPHFQTLHVMFEAQYTELWAAVDEVAERIRALGFPAPCGYRAFEGLSRIDSDDGANSVLSAREMVASLLGGHEVLVRGLREAQRVAASVGDEASADLLVQRLQASEKVAWMLRSFLEEG